MPKFELESLERALRAAGIEAACAVRMRCEIEDHLIEAAQDAEAAGLDPHEAQAVALAALGTESAIVKMACEWTELLEWGRRWPRLANGLKTLAGIGQLPAIPIVYLTAHGQTIVRWSVSASLASMFTCALLLAMRTALI
jgi:hypothetical protein